MEVQDSISEDNVVLLTSKAEDRVILLESRVKVGRVLGLFPNSSFSSEKNLQVFRSFPVFEL